MPTTERSAYSDARERLQAITADEADIVHPEGHTRFYLHDAPAKTAIVLFHGLTSSPRQFDYLARKCFERGANVYLPRLPYHGLSNPLSEDIKMLTEEDLTIATNEAVTIAGQLGDEVVVSGISLGGTLAALAAQVRPDVHRALLIAPLFNVHILPRQLVPQATALLRALPNRFLWWHPLKRGSKSPPASYPRFSTHSLAACLDLATSIEAMSRKEAPQSYRQIALVNTKDPAVSNAATRVILRNWRKAGGRNVSGYQFSRVLPPLHDFITPERGSAYARYVDPVLLRFLLTDA